MPSLENLLQDQPVQSSAPCRVDCGGTWDLRAFALPYHHIGPVTFNIALNLRTHVTLKPFREGWIKVSSKGFLPEEHPSHEAPFSTPMGLAFAIATYFNCSGVEILIDSESPPKSALGGSGAAGVALVGAFAKALQRLGAEMLSKNQIVTTAFQIEDGLAVSLTGPQDQTAAAFGGVNLWTWTADNDFIREALVDTHDIQQFTNNFVVAYGGETHNSSDINTKWVRGFLEAHNRSLWFEMNAITKDLGGAIAQAQWSDAASALNHECELRCSITPEVLTENTKELVEIAKASECGARFTGSGGGGCVWAIGEQEKIRATRDSWGEFLSGAGSGKILDCRVDSEGILIN